MPKYKLDCRRLIFNADFPVQIDFFENQYKIIKESVPNFPDWSISTGSFTLDDKKNKCFSTFTPSKHVFDMHNASDNLKVAEEKILKSIEVFNKYIPIPNFNRMGIRFYMFVPMIEMKAEELTDLIHSKLYVKNEETLKFFPKEYRDLAYIVDYKKDDFFYHFKCAPILEENIPNWYPTDINDIKRLFVTEPEIRAYVSSFPNVSLIIDVDCYQINKPNTDLKEFLAKSINSCIQLAGGVKNHILGKDS